jgi:flagellar hook-associated protein 1 FlgK
MSGLGFSIAASGLAADTAELNTASNNLANISTQGYVEEQVNLTTQPAGGMSGVGGGVEIGSVSRMVSQIYQQANLSAQNTSGAANQTNQVYQSIQTIFPEPSSAGLASQLSNLWSDISTLASNPGQQGAEQTVVGAAQAVTQTLNNEYGQLSNLSSSLQTQLGSGSSGGQLAQVNSLLSQVGQVNKSIIVGASGGNSVNSLLDQNNSSVLKLASLMGIRAVTEANGTTSLYMNGIQLVTGDVVQQLGATGSANTKNLGIVTANGAPVSPLGSIGAALAAVNNTIPQYQSQLNNIADSLAEKMNQLQANGLNINGTPGSSVPGATGTTLPDIFVNNGSSTSYTPSSATVSSAATIAVSPALIADNTLIATAAAPSSSNSNSIGTPTLDGSNAQAMAALQTVAGGPNDLYQQMIGQLGTEALNATNNLATANNAAQSIKNNISSVSGVNMNSEELKVLAAQNAYSAIGHVIDAINLSFQSLIQAV